MLVQQHHFQGAYFGKVGSTGTKLTWIGRAPAEDCAFANVCTENSTSPDAAASLGILVDAIVCCCACAKTARDIIPAWCNYYLMEQLASYSNLSGRRLTIVQLEEAPHQPKHQYVAKTAFPGTTVWIAKQVLTISVVQRRYCRPYEDTVTK